MTQHRYHHGNLKRALVDAALVLFEERGTLDFTMRELARTAGVTHNAPYRHFADRDALRTAIALEGFEGMTAGFTKLGGVEDPRKLVKDLGEAYVRYAIEHPNHFRIMFQVPIDTLGADDPLRAARTESFGALVSAIAACKARGFLREGVGARRVALLAWSFVHGLASLHVSGELAFDEARLRATVRDFAALFFGDEAPKKSR